MQDQPQKDAPAVTIVVPCFNEADCLPNTARQLAEIVGKLRDAGTISAHSMICLVDDGSNDDTWSIIQAWTKKNNLFSGIRLTRNFGHQNALLAGLLTVPGDVAITIDADLQDDPSVIAGMLVEHQKGADIVYAVRKSRHGDSWLKRRSAECFYSLMRALGTNLIDNHADYRLMSRRALESLREYREVNLFLRGLVTDIGYPSAIVQYERGTRAAGQSKYPLKRIISLGLKGLTSFSAAPLRLIALIGVIVFLGSVLISLWALWVRFVAGNAIPGWASSVIPLYILGGIQLLSIAIVGEYVAKIFLESKARPRFLIQETSALPEQQSKNDH